MDKQPHQPNPFEQYSQNNQRPQQPQYQNNQEPRQKQYQNNQEPRQTQQQQQPINNNTTANLTNGLIEIFNIIGQALLSNKFVGFVTKVLTTHVEVLNYIISGFMTKEFYTLTIKYTIILLVTFTLKSLVVGSNINPMILIPTLPVLYLIYTKVKGQLTVGTKEFIPKQTEEMEVEVSETEEHIKENIENVEDIKPPIKKKENKRFYIEDIPKENERKVVQEGVTVETLSTVRNLFTQSQDKAQEMVFSGNHEIYQKAMTKDLAEGFGIKMDTSKDYKGNVLKKLSKLNVDTSGISSSNKYTELNI